MLESVRLGGCVRLCYVSVRVIAAALLTLAATASWTSTAAADLDAEVVFHIKAQPLEGALLEFSKQANTPVAFAAKSIGALMAPGLDGKFAPSTALAVLLCNSGLAYAKVGDTVTVVPVSARGDSKACGSTTAAANTRN